LEHWNAENVPQPGSGSAKRAPDAPKFQCKKAIPKTGRVLEMALGKAEKTRFSLLNLRLLFQNFNFGKASKFTGLPVFGCRRRRNYLV
jgi:hypothetical protein